MNSRLPSCGSLVPAGLEAIGAAQVAPPSTRECCGLEGGSAAARVDCGSSALGVGDLDESAIRQGIVRSRGIHSY